MINATLRRKREMRCAEYVLTVVGDPVRDDPWGALIFDTIMNCRRAISKNFVRCEKFIGSIVEKIYLDATLDKLTPSPTTGFLGALLDINATIDATGGFYVY